MTSQTLYDRIAQYYDLIVAQHVESKMEVLFIERILRESRAVTVLDIACGTGRHSIGLAAAGFKVTGVDCCAPLIEIARSKAGTLDVDFIVQDVAELALDTRFDAGICMWSTFGELPYHELLGQFIMDGKNWTGKRPKLRYNTGHAQTIHSPVQGSGGARNSERGADPQSVGC